MSDYSERAILEGLVNSLIHRSYEIEKSNVFLLALGIIILLHVELMSIGYNTLYNYDLYLGNSLKNVL